MVELDLKDIERRPLRHWNIDGLPELYMGLLWLVWGGLWIYGQSLLAGLARKIFWGVVPMLLVAATFLGGWFLKKIKERITYPRAGYVQPGRQRQRAAWAAIVGALAVVAAFPMARSADLRALMPLLASAALSAVFALTARRMQVPFFLWYAPVPLLLQAGYYWIRGSFLSLEWMFVILGALCTVGGAIRLRRFLRANPKPADLGV